MGVLCESLGPETFSRLQDGAGLMQHVLLTLVSGLDSLEKRLTAAQNATEEKVRQLQLSLENLSSHILAEEEEELEEERCEQSLELKEPEGSWMGGENNDIKESPTDLEGELEGDAQSVDAIGTTANENEMSHSGSTGNEEDSKHEDHEESGAVEVMPGSQNGSEQARQRWQWAYGQVRTMLRERKPMKRSSSISSTSSSTSGKRLHSRVAALEAVIENLQRELEVQAQQRELALQEAQTQQNKLESTLKDAAAKSSQAMDVVQDVKERMLVQEGAMDTQARQVGDLQEEVNGISHAMKVVQEMARELQAAVKDNKAEIEEAMAVALEGQGEADSLTGPVDRVPLPTIPSPEPSVPASLFTHAPEEADKVPDRRRRSSFVSLEMLEELPKRQRERALIESMGALGSFVQDVNHAMESLSSSAPSARAIRRLAAEGLELRDSLSQPDHGGQPQLLGDFVLNAEDVIRMHHAEVQGGEAGLTALKCTGDNIITMPERLKSTQVTLSHLLAQQRGGGDVLLDLLRVNKEIDGTLSRIARLECELQKATERNKTQEESDLWVKRSIDQIWAEIHRHHDPNQKDGVLTELQASTSSAIAAGEAPMPSIESASSLEDPRFHDIYELRTSISAAWDELEALKAQLTAKADSKDAHLASVTIQALQAQVQKLSGETVTRDALEGYLRAKIDRRDLDRLAALLTGTMSREGADPDTSSAMASRISHQMRCLSCDRRLPGGVSSGPLPPLKSNGEANGANTLAPSSTLHQSQAARPSTTLAGDQQRRRHDGISGTHFKVDNSVDAVIVVDSTVVSQYPRMMPPPQRNRTAVGGGIGRLK